MIPLESLLGDGQLEARDQGEPGEQGPLFQGTSIRGPQETLQSVP